MQILNGRETLRNKSYKKSMKEGLTDTPMGYIITSESEGKHMDELEKQEQKEEGQDCCCHKTKERSEKEYKDLMNRLSRIEGQIRGIKGMVEKNCYCPDIITQVAAANAALNSFNKVLLANHIKTCVIKDIKEGKEETMDELLTTLQKLMK